MPRMLSRLVPLLLFSLAFPVPGGAQDDAEVDVPALQRAQEALAQEVATLRDNLVLLEARLHDQQQQILELREKRTSPPPAPPASAQGPSEQYLRAFGDYAAGRYSEAIAGFEAFIRTNPGSDFAASAQYWLGDCYFSQQQYALAVAELRKVVGNYPNSPKTPDALLKMAAALRTLKLDDQARESLETLRTQYPNSPAARQVRPQN